VIDACFILAKTETIMAKQSSFMLILGHARLLLKKVSTGILDSFNRMVQFWNGNVLLLQVCLVTDTDTDNEWQYNGTCQSQQR
jgi:hypothetical protein